MNWSNAKWANAVPKKSNCKCKSGGSPGRAQQNLINGWLDPWLYCYFDVLIWPHRKRYKAKEIVLNVRQRKRKQEREKAIGARARYEENKELGNVNDLNWSGHQELERMVEDTRYQCLWLNVCEMWERLCALSSYICNRNVQFKFLWRIFQMYSMRKYHRVSIQLNMCLCARMFVCWCVVCLIRYICP